MLVTTKAIVISKLKYQDNDLIVKCYTDYFGIQSYLLRGVLKNKKGKIKPAYFQELSQLQVTVNYKQNRSLQSISEAKPLSLYHSMYTNVAKSAIAMFLAEMLSSILKEEEPNPSLFSFLESALLWLDEHDSVANFHMLFLLKLTKFLGFFPDLNNGSFNYFNLEEGCFQEQKTNDYCISGEKLVLLKQLMGMNFDELNEAHFNSEKRQHLIKIMLLYYELHLGSLKQPKSLQILNQVFS